MNKELKDIIDKIMQNKRIANRIKFFNLSENQILDSLPIFIDMLNEKDDEKTEVLTSFNISTTGSIKKINILSTFGKKIGYMNNIITQNINPINFEEEKEFHKDEARKTIINEFSKFLKSENINKKGFYLYGKMGIGKTFILKRFCKLLAEKGKKVGFINVSNLIQVIKSTFNKITSSQSITILKTLQNVEYLFIDDIGAEKISSWFRDEFLFPLLNERMERKKITFFSSNYSFFNLAKQESKTNNSQYQDFDKSNRLISRIKALSVEMNITGINKRY